MDSTQCGSERAGRRFPWRLVHRGLPGLHANRIHSAGRAIVWSGHREAAELYWSRLEELGLTMAPLGS